MITCAAQIGEREDRRSMPADKESESALQVAESHRGRSLSRKKVGEVARPPMRARKERSAAWTVGQEERQKHLGGTGCSMFLD